MPKKEKQGVVISNKMDKTIVVKVADYEPAHDEGNVCSEGDVVRIVESRPISGGKRWTLAEVVEKAR